MQKTATAYALITDELNNNDVRYCLLRDHNPDAPELDELDLLVWPDSRDAFAEIIQEQGFRLRNDAPGKAVFAKFEGQRLLLLDVHFAFIQNGFVYMPLEGVYERCQKTPAGYNILSPEDELLHLFFHNLIGKKHLQNKHLAMVKDCLSRQPDTHYLHSRIADAAIREIFHLFCSNPESFTDREGIARDAARRIRERLEAAGKQQKSEQPSAKKRKRGVHFAFLGVDGAGKSTTVEHVQQLLDAAGKVKYQFVYMGPWGYVRSPVLKKIYDWKLFPHKIDWQSLIAQKLRGQKVPHALPVMVAKWVSGTFKGWIYYAAVYVEMWYRYLREVRPNLRKGRIVLSDRYVYDLRYIYKKRPVSQFKLWRWFVCRFFPQPDRVVFIWNTAGDIIARKPQLGAEEIDAFQGYYRRVLQDIPTIELRSDRSPETLAGEIVREIMRIYLEDR